MATLGIDLGGTYARAALVDDQGQLLAAAKTALDDRSPGAVVASIAEAAAAALASAGGLTVDGVGVGVAGQLGPDGVVKVGPNLGWRDVPFGELLSARLGRPVTVVNDLAAAAWGEFRAGAGVGVQDLWVVFVGSGVGSAIIAGGRALRGATGVAGEFGHIKVVPGGRRCGCGELGCLEAYVGGRHLIERMRELIASPTSSLLTELSGGDPARLNPALLEQAAMLGDSVARNLYDQTAGFLGLAIANQVTVLNPARLILGGGVLTHAPGLRQRIQDAVKGYANRNARDAVTITEAALGDDAGLVGAALLAIPAKG